MQKDTLQEPSISSPSQRFAVIIANPKAGGFPRRAHHLEKALTFLHQQGWKVDLWLTQAARHAQQLAQDAVTRGADLVIAAGSDGTINEVIQGVAGTETTLGVLPFGSTNVWAQELGISLEDARTYDVFVNGQTRRIDLGYINGRYFLLMAGIGFDAEVVYAVEKKPAKRWGMLSYLLISLWLGMRYSGFRAHLSIDGRTVRTDAFLIIIGNTQLHGGLFKFMWQARCDDGQLDLCVVRKHSVLERIVVLRDVLFQRDQCCLWVYYATCTSVKIRTQRPIAIQIDGEPKRILAHYWEGLDGQKMASSLCSPARFTRGHL